MTEHNDTTTDRTSDIGLYALALSFGGVIVVASLGSAVGMNVGVYPWIGRELGAAWAWAIGAATGLWVIPWARKEIRSIQGDECSTN